MTNDPHPNHQGTDKLTSYQLQILRDRARYLRRYIGAGGFASSLRAKLEWKTRRLHGEPALCLRIVHGIYNISKLG